MFQQQNFTHHGRSFTIEADDWPTEEAACDAIIDLQIWTLRLGPKETARLHMALRRETEALMHDAVYDRNAAPLPDVRDAQRHAICAGLQGEDARGLQPIVLIDAADTGRCSLPWISRLRPKLGAPGIHPSTSLSPLKVPYQ